MLQDNMTTLVAMATQNGIRTAARHKNPITETLTADRVQSGGRFFGSLCCCCYYGQFVTLRRH